MYHLVAVNNTSAPPSVLQKQAVEIPQVERQRNWPSSIGSQSHKQEHSSGIGDAFLLGIFS